MLAVGARARKRGGGERGRRRGRKGRIKEERKGRDGECKRKGAVPEGREFSGLVVCDRGDRRYTAAANGRLCFLPEPVVDLRR